MSHKPDLNAKISTSRQACNNIDTFQLKPIVPEDENKNLMIPNKPIVPEDENKNLLIPNKIITQMENGKQWMLKKRQGLDSVWTLRCRLLNLHAHAPSNSVQAIWELRSIGRGLSREYDDPIFHMDRSKEMCIPHVAAPVGLFNVVADFLAFPLSKDNIQKKMSVNNVSQKIIALEEDGICWAPCRLFWCSKSSTWKVISLYMM